MAGLEPAIHARHYCRSWTILDGRVKPGHGELVGLAASALVLCLLATPALAQSVNDYPTSARADYVFACMKANGETREALDRCSCSIDIIASILPYERYVTAETFMSLSQMSGENGAFFRSTEPSHAAVGDLKRAQAEAEVRCF